MILVDTSVLIDFFQKNENPSVLKFKEIITREIPLTTSLLPCRVSFFKSGLQI